MAQDPDPKSDLEQHEGLDDGNDAEGALEEPSFDQPVCPRCGWHNTRLSHTSNMVDSLLRMFAVRAYRCRSCGNRFRAMRRRTG
jgi:hypothetical protein